MERTRGWLCCARANALLSHTTCGDPIVIKAWTAQSFQCKYALHVQSKSLLYRATPTCFGALARLFASHRSCRYRFEAPLEPLQVLTWLLLLLIVGGFYAVIVPALPNLWAIVASIVYGVLASSTVVAGVLACWKDPIDPNVRRFHQVGHLMAPLLLTVGCTAVEHSVASRTTRQTPWVRSQPSLCACFALHHPRTNPYYTIPA